METRNGPDQPRGQLLLDHFRHGEAAVKDDEKWLPNHDDYTATSFSAPVETLCVLDPARVSKVQFSRPVVRMDGSFRLELDILEEWKERELKHLKVSGCSEIDEAEVFRIGTLALQAAALELDCSFRNIASETLFEAYRPLNACTPQSDAFLRRCIELAFARDECITPYSAQLLACTVLSATLERTMGDLFQVQSPSKPIPRLLRDMLACPEISNALGGGPIVFWLRCLVGFRTGLNVRNIAWHGFFGGPSSGELHPSYSILVLMMYATALSAAIAVLPSWPSRPLLSLEVFSPALSAAASGHLHFFPSSATSSSTISHERLHVLRSLLEQSHLIFPDRHCILDDCINLVSAGRAFEGMNLLLPQFEHILRRLFVIANNLEPYMLLAESSVLYTTLDIIWARNVIENNATLDRKNALRPQKEPCTKSSAPRLGRGASHLINDLFVWGDNARIRDRLAHGEIDFEAEMPPVIIDRMLCLLLNLATCVASSPEQVSTLDFVNQVNTTVGGYYPVYHPKHLLHSELKAAYEELSSLQADMTNNIEPAAMRLPDYAKDCVTRFSATEFLLLKSSSPLITNDIDNESSPVLRKYLSLFSLPSFTSTISSELMNCCLLEALEVICDAHVSSSSSSPAASTFSSSSSAFEEALPSLESVWVNDFSLECSEDENERLLSRISLCRQAVARCVSSVAIIHERASELLKLVQERKARTPNRRALCTIVRLSSSIFLTLRIMLKLCQSGLMIDASMETCHYDTSLRQLLQAADKWESSILDSAIGNAILKFFVCHLPQLLGPQ